MSNDAINWVKSISVKPASAKLVLFMLADQADDQHRLAWASVETLCRVTDLDDRTVLSSIKRLVAMGLIARTGEKKGGTGRVPVYQVMVGNTPNLEGITPPPNPPKNGGITPPCNPPKNGGIGAPNPPKNEGIGIPPILSPNTPKNGCEIPPKMGIAIEPNPTEPTEPPLTPLADPPDPPTPPKPAKFDAVAYLLEFGVQQKTAEDWIRLRKEKRCSPTQTAIDGVLEAISEGNLTPEQGLKLCCARGWGGFDRAWLQRDRPQAGKPTHSERMRHVGEVLTGGLRNGTRYDFDFDELASAGAVTAANRKNFS